MKLRIAAAAVVLMLAAQTAAIAAPDQNIRRQIAEMSNTNCKTDKKIRKLMPSVQTRLCNCYAAKFSRSLSSTDILHVTLGTSDKAIDAAWERKSEVALLACINGR